MNSRSAEFDMKDVEWRWVDVVSHSLAHKSYCSLVRVVTSDLFATCKQNSLASVSLSTHIDSVLFMSLLYHVSGLCVIL